jgi:two-component system, NtrC family, sensor histidine kinase PilS
VARLALATVVFVAVAWVWQRADSAASIAGTVLAVTAVVTGAAFWYTHLARRPLGRNFLYGQTIYDALLVTWIVYTTGGAESAFSPLYILVICAAAVLLPFLGGILVALLASVLYVASVAGSANAGGLHSGVLLQLGLFTIVALVTGYLGDRLRQTGTALGEAETQLELLRLDTDEILRSINTGILTVDGAGRLAYLNAAAGEMLGLDAATWMGRPVLHELDGVAPGLGWVIDRSRRERRPIARFEAGDLAAGSFVLGVSTTLLDRDGALPPVTAIFQDITEKRRLEQLERRADRLEALAELSASLAHEIKNPLASIRSAVEQLVDPQISGEDKTVLKQLAVRESNRLSRLLAEFIDFARVEVSQPTAVNLSEVVENVVALVRQHPDAERRTIHASLPPESTKLLVSGSEDLLHRAVLNLVLNAVQWAGIDGEVRITGDIARSDILSPVIGALDLVRLRVADSGPGIDPTTVDSIFDPFFTQRPGGTGLGLALVQRAAEAHGGVVFVDNADVDRAGATFTFCLPTFAAAESAERSPEPLGAPS